MGQTLKALQNLGLRAKILLIAVAVTLLSLGAVLAIVAQGDTHAGGVVIGLSVRVLDAEESEMRAAVVGVGVLALMVGVEARDHGLGMTPEQLSHVFERFYRADTSGKIPGSGLGMSIVKEIIDLHGGTIDLASEFGAGTTVTLWLPLTADLH